MTNNTKHLYIHIPFCKAICTYCDFYRTKTNDKNLINQYIQKIVNEIKQDNNVYQTIYIGGGTPNFLDDKLLNQLLSALNQKRAKDCEFTIEANPEFINNSQCEILKHNQVNRVSLGIQTTNDTILALLKRTHQFKDCVNAIKILKKFQIYNISCDFIYNLPLLKITDLKKSFAFIKTYQIPHVSFYALEVKSGAILNKLNYKIDEDREAIQLEYLKNEFIKLNYNRYEISNWAINPSFESLHNLAYWNLEDWKAIGIAAYGYEKNVYYHNQGTLLEWEKNNTFWDDKETYINTFIMGLRKKNGIDLTIPRNLNAFDYLKNKLNFKLLTIENNFIKAKNFDLLNEILLDIID
ncbi:MAG: radical SAM family heme chaperone HemW [Malacoplasma sp.]|nr:radical SAM family heme chaperone HemW [Malacoplasma sp.]